MSVPPEVNIRARPSPREWAPEQPGQRSQQGGKWLPGLWHQSRAVGTGASSVGCLSRFQRGVRSKRGDPAGLAEKGREQKEAVVRAPGGLWRARGREGLPRARQGAGSEASEVSSPIPQAQGWAWWEGGDQPAGEEAQKLSWLLPTSKNSPPGHLATTPDTRLAREPAQGSSPLGQPPGTREGNVLNSRVSAGETPDTMPGPTPPDHHSP